MTIDADDADWRNKPVDIKCTCGTVFVGKYNSRRCPDCKDATRKTAFKKFKDKNPTYWAEWQRRTAPTRMPFLAPYGLTPDDYCRMLDEQDGKCAICRAEAGGWIANGGRLVVDHDHDSGDVRGLLCPPCNRGIGQFVDSPTSLRAAADYLEREAFNERSSQS